MGRTCIPDRATTTCTVFLCAGFSKQFGRFLCAKFINCYFYTRNCFYIIKSVLCISVCFAKELVGLHSWKRSLIHDVSSSAGFLQRTCVEGLDVLAAFKIIGNIWNIIFIKFRPWLYGKAVAKPRKVPWCEQQVPFLYGVCPAKTDNHFTSTPGSRFTGEKGLGGLYSLVLLPLSSTSTAQPWVPSTFFFVMWFHWLASAYSGSRVMSHQPRAGTAAALHVQGTFASRQLLRPESGFSLCVCVQPCFSIPCKPLTRRRWERWQPGGSNGDMPSAVHPASKCQQAWLMCLTSLEINPCILVRQLLPALTLMTERDHVEHVCNWFRTVVWQNTIALYEALI